MIATSDKKIEEQPDLVKRFVDASIEGWYSYLYGDPTPGNTLIKQANPGNERCADRLWHQVDEGARDLGLGRRGEMGIGAMTAHVGREFYQAVSDDGLYPKGLDVTKAYTLQFVNKKVGMDLKNP